MLKQNAFKKQELFEQNAWRQRKRALLSSKAMKTTKDFRRHHFQALVAKYGRKEMQERLDCSSAYVGQLDGSAKQSRNIGDAKARQIERIFGLNVGALDIPPAKTLPAQVGNELSVPPHRQSIDTMREDPSTLQLVEWFRHMSAAHQERALLQCKIWYLEDNVLNADPFTAAGLTNLNKEGLHGTERHTAASKSKPGQHRRTGDTSGSGKK